MIGLFSFFIYPCKDSGRTESPRCARFFRLSPGCFAPNRAQTGRISHKRALVNPNFVVLLHKKASPFPYIP